jgi:hypothetical protein
MISAIVLTDGASRSIRGDNWPRSLATSCFIGGEGGIRTLDPLAGTPVFKSQDTLTRATYPHANALFYRMRGSTLCLSIAGNWPMLQLECNCTGLLHRCALLHADLWCDTRCHGSSVRRVNVALRVHPDAVAARREGYA